MHTEISYKGLPREDADKAAIQDIREWLSQEAMETLVHTAGRATDAQGFSAINFALSFAGVSGYPVHAFGRRYCLEAYRAWMAEPDEEGVSYPTDEQGFKLDLTQG